MVFKYGFKGGEGISVGGIRNVLGVCNEALQSNDVSSNSKVSELKTLLDETLKTPWDDQIEYEMVGNQIPYVSSKLTALNELFDRVRASR